MGKTKKILGHTVTLLNVSTHTNVMIDGKLYATYPDAFSSNEIYRDVKFYLLRSKNNGEI